MAASPTPSPSDARPPDEVLQAHRRRIRALDEAMERLQAMHEEAYDLWQRIVKLAESEADERQEQLDVLHDEAYALADRIARLREEAFGSIGREALLRLTASVESVHPSLLHPEPTPVPGE
jgi:hypothetical protein